MAPHHPRHLQEEQQQPPPTRSRGHAETPPPATAAAAAAAAATTRGSGSGSGNSEPAYTPREIALALLDPWLFLWFSLTMLPRTLLLALSGCDLRTLVWWPRLQAAWFGTFWAAAAPGVREAGEKNVVPLLEGRVRRGVILKETGGGDAAVLRHPPVSGTVLEIGPGTGMWVSLFSDRYLSSGAPAAGGAGAGGGRGEGHGTGVFVNGDSRDNSPTELRQRAALFREQQQVVGSTESSSPAASTSRVTRVIGVEPNADVHSLLLQQVHDAGLGGVYEVVPTGIEHLSDSGAVAKGSVDCIVSVLCLCSIPDPERNIRELYTYLKPGGRWYVYEHVRVTRNWWLAWYQAFLNLIWPHMIGGCELCRDTSKTLRQAGPWSSIDLAQPVTEPWFFTLPHIIGVLTK